MPTLRHIHYKRDLLLIADKIHQTHGKAVKAKQALAKPKALKVC